MVGAYWEPSSELEWNLGTLNIEPYISALSETLSRTLRPLFGNRVPNRVPKQGSQAVVPSKATPFLTWFPNKVLNRVPNNRVPSRVPNTVCQQGSQQGWEQVGLLKGRLSSLFTAVWKTTAYWAKSFERKNRNLLKMWPFWGFQTLGFAFIENLRSVISPPLQASRFPFFGSWQLGIVMVLGWLTRWKVVQKKGNPETPRLGKRKWRRKNHGAVL